MSFKFVKHQNIYDEMLYNPKKKTTSFYQVCKFKDDEEKHLVRKVILNERGDIISYREKKYSNKKINKFLETCPQNKYKIYNTLDLELVELPKPEEILCSQSELLGSNNLDINRQFQI